MEARLRSWVGRLSLPSSNRPAGSPARGWAWRIPSLACEVGRERAMRHDLLYVGSSPCWPGKPGRTSQLEHDNLPCGGWAARTARLSHTRYVCTP